MGPRCPYTFNKQLFLINPHIKTNSRFFFYALTRFGKLKHFLSSFTNFHHTLFTLLPLRTKLQQAVAASRLVVQLIFSQHFFLLWLKGFHTLFSLLRQLFGELTFCFNFSRVQSENSPPTTGGPDRRQWRRHPGPVKTAIELMYGKRFFSLLSL